MEGPKKNEKRPKAMDNSVMSVGGGAYKGAKW